MIRYSRYGRLPLVLLVVALLSMPTYRALAKEGKDMLVPVLVDGKPSQILQKVIVINRNARLLDAPGSRNNTQLKPCQIFYRMKGDDGSLETPSGSNTFWRVGDSEGNSKGWIEKSFLQTWNTRFVLDPEGIATDAKPFKVYDSTNKDDLGEIPSGIGDYTLAFVIDKPKEEEEYPVAVYTGPISDKNDESDKDDLGMDVAFVLEMTDYGLIQWEAGGPTNAQLFQDLIAKFAATAKSRPNVAGRVRFAAVQYQDTRGDDDKQPLFVAKKVVDFVDSEADLRSGLAGLQPKEIGGDWPEDGLAGIKLAIDDLKWRQDSTKHIVLIGSGPLQDKPKGKQISMFRRRDGQPLENNPITMPNDGVDRNGLIPYGWSSTGLDIRGAIAAASQARNLASNSQIEVLKGVKTLHAILVGEEQKDVPDDIKQLVDDLLSMNEEKLQEAINKRAKPQKALDSLIFFAVMKLQHSNRGLAESQYKELGANNGQPGVYYAAQPSREGTEQAVALLLEKITTAFGDMEAALGGATVNTTNEFSQSVVKIAAKYFEQYKDKTVLKGLAYATNNDGKEVAKLKVLVTRQEVERLKSTLDSILENFETMDAKQRKDVGKTLETLQRAIASRAAGQTFDEKTTLASVIGDLPMKTPVLATTAKAIASMSSDELADWVDQLRYSISRCDALLKSQKRRDFEFLEQSQLP
ncbi:MAG: hypothetical protein EBZ48_08845 [Proteobacteria bacterium]|nr:hypothetical protein [Pseudomonadota bacterium]